MTLSPHSSDQAEDRLDTRLLVPIADACGDTGLSRSYLYEAMAAGELAFVKIGRRRLIPRAALLAWVERLSATPRPAA